METVGRPGVLKIVNDGGQYRGKDFQVAQPVLSSAHKCIFLWLKRNKKKGRQQISSFYDSKVDRSCQQQLNRNRTYHQASLVEHIVECLSHISRMSVIMIQVAMLAVASFRLIQKGLERACWDLRAKSGEQEIKKQKEKD